MDRDIHQWLNWNCTCSLGVGFQQVRASTGKHMPLCTPCVCIVLKQPGLDGVSLGMSRHVKCTSL